MTKLYTELCHSVNFCHLSVTFYRLQLTYEQKIIVLLNNNFEQLPEPTIQRKYFFKDFKTNASA